MAARVSATVKSVVRYCDGKFRAVVEVENHDTGVQQGISIALAGFINVNGVTSDPTTPVVIGNNGTRDVTVSGQLTNPCLNGALTFTATGDSVVVSGAVAINVPAGIVTATATTPRPVTGTPKEFTYNVTWNCCPLAPARRYNLKAEAVLNVSNLALSATSFACPAGITVTVTGDLDDQSTKGIVIVRAMSGRALRCAEETVVGPF
ncbi:MAG TPA: hypothetical protein VKI44_35660 [Acetobacteraceae bacterium]|nr:hypothetical protein [Acetobacteraceae bacterium]